MTEKRITFPHMGNYWVGFKSLAEMLGCEVVVPPPMTRRTLELGARHSPEFVCLPFKYNLGNFIEALEAGANVVIQAGGGCRFGYYGEVQEVILRDLGYDFEFVQLGGCRRNNVWSFAADFKSLNPRNSYRTIWRAFRTAWRKAEVIDEVEDLIRKNIGFEAREGDFERAEKRFLRELDGANTRAAIDRVGAEAIRSLGDIPLDKPAGLMRVGVVGELYVLMEPFCNYQLEKRLAKHGVEVHRFVTMSNMLTHHFQGKDHLRKLLALADPYLRYHVGADGTESVAMAHKLMRDGFDGIIHIKPFGCMPEVNAMSALQRLSREHTFPVMYISYDSQNSETGVLTRLEAFCDMLSAKKRKSRAYA